MKAKYYLLQYILLFTIVLDFSRCKKFVQISPPETQLVTSTVFSNSATATAAQTVIYSEMFNNEESYNLEMNTGLLSDELTNYSTNKNYLQFYTNAMLATNDPGPWNNAYNYIYQANAILTALQGNNEINPAISQQLIGESEFIRAFWYFYLTNLYGDIPLVTTTSYTTNATIARTPRTKVYQQIIADLQNAQKLLSSNYIDATDTTITTERTRPTMWAATALLARVYLYMGDYTDAATEATTVINNSTLYELVPPDNVFLKNSTEAIWQLAPGLPTNVNTYEGYFFHLTSSPQGSCCTMSPQLLSSFDSGDNRRIQWVDSLTKSGSTYYYPYKYKVKGGVSVTSESAVTEYEMVLRLAEQYLIRAEAEANGAGNGIPGAVADLNVIRNRAGLPNYTGSTSVDSLEAGILHERQVELFTEWGNRWFDLIRTSNANSVMSVVTPEKKGTWNTDGDQLLYPIPQADITVDPNLTQNPGY